MEQHLDLRLVAVLAVVLSMFNAFALGIGRVKERRWIVLLIMLANMLPQEAAAVPAGRIMFKKIGLYNSPWAMIIFTVIQSVRHIPTVIGLRYVPQVDS